MHVMAGDLGIKSAGKTTTYTWYVYQTHFYFDTSGVTDTVTDAKFSMHATWYVLPQSGNDSCGNSMSTYDPLHIIAIKSTATPSGGVSNYNDFEGHTSSWVGGTDTTDYSSSYGMDDNEGPSNGYGMDDAIRQDMPLNNTAKTDIKDDDDFKILIIDKEQVYDNSVNTCYGSTATGRYYAKYASNRNTNASFRPYLVITTQTATTPEDNSIFFGTL